MMCVWRGWPGSLIVALLSYMANESRQKQPVPQFSLAFPSNREHNYKDSNGHRLTSARTPSESSERARGCPSASRHRDRSSLSRQRVLRSERLAPGQVRDAAQRPERRARGRGGCASFWRFPPCVLRHPGIVRARRPTRTLSSQARAERSAQARRRSCGLPPGGGQGSRADAYRRRTGGALETPVWCRGPSTQHPEETSAPAAPRGKKTTVTIAEYKC